MAKLGEHAVVLGASMAGLVAARALAEFFETVTVVERDTLSDAADHRRGVPQGRQAQGLIMRGAQALEELFPGILDELVGAGAPSIDYRDLSKLHFNMGGHLAVQSGSAEGLRAYTPSRPFLESHTRRRVRAIPNIAFLDNHDVVDVTSNTSRDRITGARIVSRHSHSESELSADLVVDATGRGARTPAMLERLGYARPAEDDVVIHLTYASQLLRMPPESLHECAGIVAPVPGRPTGMAILRYEHDTVMFAVFGMAGNDPPVGCSAMCGLRRTICARPPFGGHSGGRTSWRDSAASVPVEPLAPVRQSATAARRLAGRRRRGVQLQPDLRAGYDGGRTGSFGAAKLPVPGHNGSPAAVLPSYRKANRPGLAAGRRR
jgi:hypothetical protein